MDDTSLAWWHLNQSEICQWSARRLSQRQTTQCIEPLRIFASSFLTPRCDSAITMPCNQHQLQASRPLSTTNTPRKICTSPPNPDETSLHLSLDDVLPRGVSQFPVCTSLWLASINKSRLGPGHVSDAADSGRVYVGRGDPSSISVLSLGFPFLDPRPTRKLHAYSQSGTSLGISTRHKILLPLAGTTRPHSIDSPTLVSLVAFTRV
ncbi:hypothetical protein R3P38DRAFT_1701681 [Favolaschia claudopus]|uniref:Uncharacterized protein n=1 Tax=Favolaschia claudopus TaxID=2862362 RepID=A0AAW0AAD3_9AGAR